MFSHTNKKLPSLQGKRIGVIGLGPRCGATHISLSIGNFISDFLKFRVCLKEINAHGDFNEICRYLGRAGSDEGDFIFHRVSYYPFLPADKSLSRLTDSFDCTVMDLGCSMDSAREALELCDYRIVVGMGACWREKEFSQLTPLFTGDSDLSNWILYINLGTPLQIKYYKKLGFATYAFPFEPDPFNPCEASKIIMEKSLTN